MKFADLKKTIYFLERNGLKQTWYAVRERLEERKGPRYEWVPAGEAELEAQRVHWKEASFSVTFSILTPAYRTGETYLRELIESLRQQTYPKWELILADATEDDSVERVVRTIQDSRVRYIRLRENAGIACNTNQALPFAAGDYAGLLDHDDVLTKDALYEMAARIEQGKKQGCEPQMLYSDEDKCNGDQTVYFEPNIKEDFNLDLLLSNNYICHFLVMKRELIQGLGLRAEYDGAQDYDLVLRAAAKLKEREGAIVHIPKVLYHWRCHTASTAENPHSKLYAYEAGRRALQDFADQEGWKAEVVHTSHVGFYALRYKGDTFLSRQDVGIIGGRVVERGGLSGGRAARKEGVSGGRAAGKEGVSGGRAIRKEGLSGGRAAVEEGVSGGRAMQRGGSADRRAVWKRRLIGGRMTEDGKVFYENLPMGYSGYLHRAVLQQDAAAVDIRNIQVREECQEIFRRITGVPYRTVQGQDYFDVSLLPQDCDMIQMSLELCSAVREAGYKILYLPELCVEID